MPKHPIHNGDFHATIYLVIALLYLLSCMGFDKASIEAGLVVCYWALHRS